MTDIEPKEVFRQKAIDLINEYRQVRGLRLCEYLEISSCEMSAFIRSIQLHEKTKQELHDLQQKVSDIASAYNQMAFTVSEPHLSGYRVIIGFDKHAYASMCHDRLVSLLDFLNPKPKPDPLVEVLLDMELSSDQEEGQHDAKWLRLKLDALGFEIREKGQ